MIWLEVKDVLSTVYFETYGCQMNVNDTEIAWSILKDEGYTKTQDVEQVPTYTT